MTFRYDWAAMDAFSTSLNGTYEEVFAGENYVHVHGDFSFHETGIIGVVFQRHAALMNDLDDMFNHLETILYRSNEAVGQVARLYNGTDERNAAEIDAEIPPTIRPMTFKG